MMERLDAQTAVSDENSPDPDKISPVEEGRQEHQENQDKGSPFEIRKDLEWLDKETGFADRFFSILFKGKIVKFIVLIAILVLLFFKYQGFFFLIFFSFLTNYIRYKRLKRWLLFDVEPTYVFSIILALKFNIFYGLLFIMFPVTIPTLKYGITSNIVMRIWNKLLVLLGTYGLYQFFPNHIMIYSISLVALTDIITFMFFLRLGNKSYDTFLNFATNLIFRSAYFFILFEVFNIL